MDDKEQFDIEKINNFYQAFKVCLNGFNVEGKRIRKEERAFNTKCLANSYAGLVFGGENSYYSSCSQEEKIRILNNFLIKNISSSQTISFLENIRHNADKETYREVFRYVMAKKSYDLVNTIKTYDYLNYLTEVVLDNAVTSCQDKKRVVELQKLVNKINEIKDEKLKSMARLTYNDDYFTSDNHFAGFIQTMYDNLKKGGLGTFKYKMNGETYSCFDRNERVNNEIFVGELKDDNLNILNKELRKFLNVKRVRHHINKLYIKDETPLISNDIQEAYKLIEERNIFVQKVNAGDKNKHNLN